MWQLEQLGQRPSLLLMLDNDLNFRTFNFSAYM
jgi:hypothetical protein